MAKPRVDPPLSTTTLMGNATAHVTRTPQPRYVHGGGYRNTSRVALDRNLDIDGSAVPTDFTTMSHSLHSYHGDTAQKATHRFNLPQKNVSTFLNTSVTVAEEVRHGRAALHATCRGPRHPNRALTR